MTFTTAIFEPSSNFDNFQAQQLHQDINQNLEEGVKIFLIDLKNVTFMDSSSFATLLTIRKKIQATGGKLFLCTLTEPLKLFIQLTSLDGVFEILAKQEDYLSISYSVLSST